MSADDIIGMANDPYYFSDDAALAPVYGHLGKGLFQCATGDFVGCGESVKNAVHSAQHALTNMHHHRSSGQTDSSGL